MYDVRKNLYSESGYTLFSLISVIIISGILATIAIVSFNTSNPKVKLEMASKKLISDVCFAQDLAMARATEVLVVFDVGENRYSLKWGDGSYIANLMGGNNFIVDLDNSDFSGVNMNTTSLVAGTLSFSPVGVPSSGGTKLENNTLITTLNNQISISITPYTGKLVIERN